MKTRLLFLIFSLLIILIIGTALPSKAYNQPVSPQLRLHRGILDLQNLQGMSGPWETPSAGSFAIIQFRSPITQADKASLEQTGVTILEYLPDFAYLVKGTEIQLNAAETIPQVYGWSPFTLADKLSPSLLKVIQENNMPFIGRIRVTGWVDDHGELVSSLAGLTFNLSSPLTQNQLFQLASLPAVRWIEPYTEPKLLNDYARTIMDVNIVWQTTSLFGNGQILAIADSGLDTGNAATLSPDFAGRIWATFPLAPGGDWTDQHGHGTHVAGSAVGSGVQSGSNPGSHDYATSFAGLAPEASLVVQAFEVDESGAIIGLPDDYSLLFSQAYTTGARLHSDSWGDITGPITDTEAAYGGYPYGAQRTDNFIWTHPDMAIFVAAGNSGVDGVPGPFGFCTGGDGVIDPDSLLSPGTAKNVITVGASESYKDEGPLQGFPWILLSFCFATEPIATDVIADNFNGMAAFSSRGPADDGRVKPDIIAPGTNIVSNRSHDPAAGTLWSVHQTNPDYVYSGGTSMATPLTAGMGTLVREWLNGQGTANPSAALIKATLLNTTEDMAPGQYGTGTTQEIPFNRPNSIAGWGRASLGFVSPPPNYFLWFDDHATGLSTGESVIYTDTPSRPLEVLTDTLPLRIMLVWTDPPASLSASSQLVNDLDLVVTGPGGTYYGNDIPTGDRVNNVEGIIIDNPPIGTYQVSVSAFNVPVSSQPYALVVAGPLIVGSSPTPTPSNTPTTTLTPTTTNTSTPTNIVTATPSPTDTPTTTNTPSSTPTSTTTSTITPSPTNTPTNTATQTPLPPNTPTPTNTSSSTPTSTTTSTATPSPTNTPTNTATQTPTFTPTSTNILTPTPSNTPTPTFSPSPTTTPSPTLDLTGLPTASPTPSQFWLYLPSILKGD